MVRELFVARVEYEGRTALVYLSDGSRLGGLRQVNVSAQTSDLTKVLMEVVLMPPEGGVPARRAVVGREQAE